jgi:hypothetical protein
MGGISLIAIKSISKTTDSVVDANASYSAKFNPSKRADFTVLQLKDNTWTYHMDYMPSNLQCYLLGHTYRPTTK